MRFRSTQDVDNWLAGPGNTVGLLKGKLDGGFFDADDAQWVRAFLYQLENQNSSMRAAYETQLMERATIAAERQALRATWALWIALAALALSAWPFVVKLWE